MVSLEELVSEDHIYRRFMNLWQFRSVEKHLKEVEKDTTGSSEKDFSTIVLVAIRCISTKTFSRTTFMVCKKPITSETNSFINYRLLLAK